MTRKLALLYFLILPYFVALEEEGTIHDYNPHNFKRKIKELDGNFIMFYAPWCRHCTEFHPLWQELAEMLNTEGSKYAVAQVDCTLHPKLCHDNDITGYPTLLYFFKNSFIPLEYKGTRDLTSIARFATEAFNMKNGKSDPDKDLTKVEIHNGMAYLNDHNVEKFLAQGQHFVMFYVPWCRGSQRLAPVWERLAREFSSHEYVHIGQVNCMESDATCMSFDIHQFPYLVWIVNGRIMDEALVQTFEELKLYVEKMMLTENHDPQKFMKKKKVLPVARISEETFETFLEKDIVFINYFAPWCAHCLQLSPLWLKLGEKFQNESRVLIADVDCGRSKSICEAEKINSLPTLVLYKQRKIVNVEHGGRPLETLISLVTEHLKESHSPPDKTTNPNEDKNKPTKEEL